MYLSTAIAPLTPEWRLIDSVDKQADSPTSSGFTSHFNVLVLCIFDNVHLRIVSLCRSS